MKVSTTVFLVLLLTGLGVYYFHSEKALKAGSAELTPVKILTLGEGDSFSRLVIQNESSKEPIALRRERNGWVLEAPVRYPAENFLVEGMLSALAFSQRLRRFPLEDKGGRQFGFDEPPIKIGVETEKEPRLRSLLLGKESPVAPAVYARWEGEKEYFLITPEVKAAFDRTVYSLRQKKLFRFKWNEWAEVHVRVEGKEFQLGKNEIPAEKVSDLTDTLGSLYIKEFLDGKNAGSPEFGLQSADSFIAVRDGKGFEDKILFGATAEAKDARYALRAKEKVLLLISEENLKSFLENFELTFQELADAHSRKPPADSGKNSTGRPAGPSKSG